MHMMLTLHFYSLILAKAPPYKCQRNWKKIGCYHDRIIPNRPYPYELVNHRDPVNQLGWSSIRLERIPTVTPRVCFQNNFCS